MFAKTDLLRKFALVDSELFSSLHNAQTEYSLLVYFFHNNTP